MQKKITKQAPANLVFTETLQGLQQIAGFLELPKVPDNSNELEFGIRVLFLTHLLELPSGEFLRSHHFYGTASYRIVRAYDQDPDQLFQETLTQLCAVVEEIVLPALYRLSEFHRRLNDFDCNHIFEQLVEENQFSATVATSIEALIELGALYCLYGIQSGKISSSMRIVYQLCEWFVRYGDYEVITRSDVLEALGHSCYQEYILRLPPEDLACYLTSENKKARVMARNKVINEYQDA